MYSKRKTFEAQVKAKAEELAALCQSLGIASFMSFCLEDNGDATSYKNYMHGTRSNGIRLSDDQILRHINVANGFQTIPPNTASSSDWDWDEEAIGPDGDDVE